MPLKSTSRHLVMKERDKSTKKISDYDKKLIYALYATGNYTYSSLSRVFNTTPTTIHRIVDPEFEAQVYASNKISKRRNGTKALMEKQNMYTLKTKEKRKALHTQGKLIIKRINTWALVQKQTSEIWYSSWQITKYNIVKLGI